MQEHINKIHVLYDELKPLLKAWVKRELGMDDAEFEKKHKRLKNGWFTETGETSGKINENPEGEKMKETTLPKGAKTDDAAHDAAKSGLLKDAKIAEAVREYSEDTPGGKAERANTAMRSPIKTEIPEDCREMVAQLTRLFDECEGLKEPIRVYRAVPAILLRKILDEQSYADDAFVSTTTSEKHALSRGDNLILVCDLPKGYKAVSLKSISEKPEEEEILLKNGVDLRVNGYNTKNGITYIYVEA